MWADSAVFYQIYPLGLCGAPFENDGVLTHRIRKLNSWIPHLKKLGINITCDPKHQVKKLYHAK